MYIFPSSRLFFKTISVPVNPIQSTSVQKKRMKVVDNNALVYDFSISKMIFLISKISVRLYFLASIVLFSIGNSKGGSSCGKQK